MLQKPMNRGKYAYVGLWVKYAIRKSSCVSKIPPGQQKRLNITVFVFQSTKQLIALLPPPPLLHPGSSCRSVHRGRGGNWYRQRRGSSEGWGSGHPRFDWRCFYYFVRNSLVALLEALCARIFSLDLWILGFSDFFFFGVCKVSNNSSAPLKQAPVPGRRHSSCVLIVHVCLCVCASVCARGNM